MESTAVEADVMERVIPAGYIQLMFHYKNPFVVVEPKGTFIQQPRSVISGLSNTFSDVSTKGEAGVVFVSFRPAGACHFFDFPLSEIENQSIDLHDIDQSEISRVEEALYFAQTISEKVAVIEHFLLGRWSPIPNHDSMLIRKGLDIMLQGQGHANVNYLSDKLHTSSKTLERKFSTYLGKTTKQLINLLRFQQVLQAFSECKNISLTDCAYRHGYFDQSHFIHDFKTYTGYTPGEFCARYPDFQINAIS